MMMRRSHVVRRLLLFAAPLFFAAGLLAFAFRPHTIPGTVVDANGPVAGVTVRLRASLASTTTDAQGRFTLNFRGPALHRAVTAWKEGYYPAAADLSMNLTPSAPPSLAGKGEGGIGLILKPHPTADDPTYQWLTSLPDPNAALGCGHCMTNYDEWKLDAHALSATNPRFLSMYNGADLAGRPNVGPGWKLDSPNDAGACANCHAPAAALAHNGAADMNRLTGVETEGVLCDLCHKIGDVTLDPATGLPHAVAPGVQSFRLYRPAPGTQVFFGTLDDIPRRVSALELERQSQFCAPCHSGGWWGVSAYASYDEWLASPYAAEGVTCQACHMPPEGKSRRIVPRCPPTAQVSPKEQAAQPLSEAACTLQSCVDCHLRPADPAARNALAATALIPDRPPETLHTHRMTGVTDEAFMRSSVAMTVTATQGPDGVLVNVAITNVGAGHSVPSDSPLRNMILVVTVHDAQGNPLPYLGRQVVPEWGGVDCGLSDRESAIRNPKSEIGNYAGLPGKGFAKVLEDYEGNAPAPQWRNGVHILSDNRIPARATDLSHYPFALPSPRSRGEPEGGDQPATIEVKLIFRRAFKPWADAKGWNEPDLVMAAATVTATPTDGPVVATLPVAYDTKLFAPSQATTASGERLAAADFVPPEQCSECHAGPAAGWIESGHAQATTLPFYRAWYKAATQNTQGQISPFCAGCHTPIGLLSGQIRSRWAWGGRESYPLDAQAQTGVSCAVCHSITETTGVGNTAYVVAPETALDAEHAKRNPQSAIHNPQFCAPCHEATNPTSGLPVMTTYSEWQRSRFNTGDPATATTCQGCHFADGRHGALHPEDLQKAAQVELLAPAEAVAGEELALQVRVSNVGAGHDLPTGAAELRQMWLALTVTDATGREVFASGQTNEYGDPIEGAITYGTTWRDAAGNPTDRLWEAVSLLRDHRITAGSSATETYRFIVPPGTVGPLHMRAALKYRAASGYLSALMTTYLQDKVPSSPAIEIGTAETSLPVQNWQP
ncbi:MAG: hypothetical protein CVU38_09630 [Chloroflexi bacterium HGW-Chloroflexi-1]|nr:MAG: hypothetical protein CVU38_09630 [Chloroflexi bacterium HGW-Chloroflexi-1]